MILIRLVTVGLIEKLACRLRLNECDGLTFKDPGALVTEPLCYMEVDVLYAGGHNHHFIQGWRHQSSIVSCDGTKSVWPLGVCVCVCLCLEPLQICFIQLYEIRCGCFWEELRGSLGPDLLSVMGRYCLIYWVCNLQRSL